jgi:hypothetical protein
VVPASSHEYAAHLSQAFQHFGSFHIEMEIVLL